MNNFFYYYFINALRVNFITINITKNCLKRIVNRKLKILIYSDLVYAESYCGTPKSLTQLSTVYRKYHKRLHKTWLN